MSFVRFVQLVVEANVAVLFDGTVPPSQRLTMQRPVRIVVDVFEAPPVADEQLLGDIPWIFARISRLTED